MATLTVPPGWYTDPSGRHEYRYWDGTNWTPGVSDHGVSSTDAPEMRPPPPVDVAAMRPSATSEPALEATAFARAYRAVAVPSRRVLAVQVATAGALVALLFEMIASLMLAAQVSNSLTVPTRSTLEWWSWLYDSSPVTSAYSYIATYPPVGLWPALLLAAILLSLLPLTAVQALRKAGLRAAFRWSAPSERARLAHGLAELGCSNTLFRARGRRGLLVFSTLASLAVITMSGYALIAKQALFQDSGTLTATNLPEAGVGPVVCLLGGVVALVGGLLAWPWSREQHVLVHLDGTIRPEQESGFGLPVTNVAEAATIPQPEQPAATLPSTLVASPTALAATPEPHAPPGRPRRWVVPLIAVVAAL
ncbi:MAG: DUF2510 domain-containing protein, partial [Mycobacteriaceae bacterium]